MENFNINNLYNFLYIILIAFIILSIFSNNKEIIVWSLGINIYILLKCLLDYHKCTLSYIECKIRGVKKHDGYIYNFLEKIININKRRDRYLIYFIMICVILILYYKKRDM
jgi:hypothetical protein